MPEVSMRTYLQRPHSINHIVWNQNGPLYALYLAPYALFSALHLTKPIDRITLPSCCISSQFNERFEYKCQDCVCLESTKTVTCKPKVCSKPPVEICTGPGFVYVNQTDPSDPCCSSLVCRKDLPTLFYLTYYNQIYFNSIVPTWTVLCWLGYVLFTLFFPARSQELWWMCNQASAVQLGSAQSCWKHPHSEDMNQLILWCPYSVIVSPPRLWHSFPECSSPQFSLAH